jgi:hypothetical protein
MVKNIPARESKKIKRAAINNIIVLFFNYSMKSLLIPSPAGFHLGDFASHFPSGFFAQVYLISSKLS